MRIAVPAWRDQVSAAFDFATELVVVDTLPLHGRELRRIDVARMTPPERARLMAALGVDLVICGAVSRPLAAMVAATGVRMIPFVCGSVDEVISAFGNGRLNRPEYWLPGRAGRGEGWRRRWRGSQARWKGV